MITRKKGFFWKPTRTSHVFWQPSFMSEYSLWNNRSVWLLQQKGAQSRESGERGNVSLFWGRAIWFVLAGVSESSNVRLSHHNYFSRTSLFTPVRVLIALLNSTRRCPKHGASLGSFFGGPKHLCAWFSKNRGSHVGFKDTWQAKEGPIKKQVLSHLQVWAHWKVTREAGWRITAGN